jgi:hypothetical protein
MQPELPLADQRLATGAGSIYESSNPPFSANESAIYGGFSGPWVHLSFGFGRSMRSGEDTSVFTASASIIPPRGASHRQAAGCHVLCFWSPPFKLIAIPHLSGHAVNFCGGQSLFRDSRMVLAAASAAAAEIIACRESHPHRRYCTEQVRRGRVSVGSQCLQLSASEHG